MNLDEVARVLQGPFRRRERLHVYVFVGSFDLATMKPLVERYLGGLPSSGRKESWKDTGPHPARGVVTKEVDKGIEPKSQAALVFTGSFDYDQDNRIAIRAMSEILQNRLRDVLREDLGGTYSVGVSPRYDKVPQQEYASRSNSGRSPIGSTR